MTAREFLAAVQQRADAATAGRWFSASDDEGEPGVEVDKRGLHLRHEMDYALSGSGRKQGTLDAEFIAASRTDVPRMVAAFTAALDLADDPQRHKVALGHVDRDDLLAVITDALPPKENDS